MDEKQMEMLSVKSAIERTVQNYINVYFFQAREGVENSCNQLFNTVERLIASFFVGQQIDNNYVVRSLKTGDLEISFTTNGHCTTLTFILPDQLKSSFIPFRDSISEANLRVNARGNIEVFQNGKWVEMPRQINTSPASQPTVQPEPTTPNVEEEPDDPFKAYERAKKAVRGMF